MPIDNLSKITSRSGINTTILLEAGNANVTGIVTAAGFVGPFTGGGDIAAGIITGTGLKISGISTLTGEVQIGTTTDANVKLDVEGSLRAKSAGYVAPASGTGLEIYYATNTLNDTPSGYLISYDRSSSAYKKINYDASEHKFRTSGTERLRINSTGQMGLGVSPSRHLDIKDSTGANRIVNVRGTSTSGAFVAFLDANTTDDSKCRVGSIGGNSIGLRGDAHHFENGAGTDRMVIDSNGKVSIGDGTIDG